MDRFLQALFDHLVRHGSLECLTPSGAHLKAGDGTGEPVVVRITDRAAVRALLLDPYLKLGELYMDGRFIVERGTIYDFLFLVLDNPLGSNTTVPTRFLNGMRYATRSIRQLNLADRARKNVAHHYDLDGRLYSLFLDTDQQYSCAYFEHSGQTLDEAQTAKKRHIAAKLLVEPGHKVLDIGCGWGGMGLYLAQFADAAVRGITLSTEQLGVARNRAVQRGLAGQADFQLEDYRATSGRFDRIVSVGMFEHVGVNFYQTFFDKAKSLLDDDGVMLLHTIGRSDGPGFTNPWIDRYIFPGGYIPALSEIVPHVEKAGLIITDIEFLRLHYAETLRHWRERFMARWDEAKALYDERFCRMWEFYLAGSETSFRCEGMEVFQIQIARRQESVPLTRDYIGTREAALRAREGANLPLRLAGE